MRFLFVFQDYEKQARDLVSSLLVLDVEVIVARRGEIVPGEAERQMLEQHRGSEAAACQIHRKYRKSVEGHVHFTIQPKKFRPDDLLLREWLLGATVGSRIDALSIPPSDVFSQTAEETQRLILHKNALEVADKLDGARWAFAGKAAPLLGRMAQDDATLEPLRVWDSRHGVPFAANGQVAYKYRFRLNGRLETITSEWHLKMGDKTSPERAARIYFARWNSDTGTFVLVAYVGPHPTNGTFSVDFGILN